jgi:hypothetical protein
MALAAAGSTIRYPTEILTGDLAPVACPSIWRVQEKRKLHTIQLQQQWHTVVRVGERDSITAEYGFSFF